MTILRKLFARTFHMERVDPDVDQFLQDLCIYENAINADRIDRLDPEALMMLREEHNLDLDDTDLSTK